MFKGWQIIVCSSLDEFVAAYKYALMNAGVWLDFVSAFLHTWCTIHVMVKYIKIYRASCTFDSWALVLFQQVHLGEHFYLHMVHFRDFISVHKALH